MITNDLKMKDQKSDKSPEKIEVKPNATVDKKSETAKVAETVKKAV